MSDFPTILFNNLTRRYKPFKESLNAAAWKAIDSGWVVLGSEVNLFEQSFANYLGVDYCIGVANGTDALELGLRSAGVSDGDHVILTANAGMYGLTALKAIGAEPVFVDVDPKSRCLSSASLQAVFDEADKPIKAVVATHLYGFLSPEIERIAEICQNHGVILMEDCAQAHGARLDGKSAGSFGQIAAFSFYPTKNLGALGDGGAVVTSNAEFAKRCRSLRQYGWSEKYRAGYPGGRNSRLDEIQAAFLNVFLPHLDQDNAARRVIAERYHAEIRAEGVILPQHSGENYVAHLFVLRCQNRKALRAHLEQHGIKTDIHYPIPDYRQPIFGSTYAGVNLPVTEELCETVLSLPCYPGLTSDEVERVIETVNSWEK
ncbi:MAG: DegT/DnrJ/EryC1/StrS family aminotransferase [Candidatus Electrothrix sp. AUS4]|nr:DegT/DnrJ/EryC1/StrS family aminotransferase [Candidatus Electrothrix sp. AUS4]